MSKSGGLSRRIALLTSAAVGAIWILAVFATTLVLKYEQEELLDAQLRETARLFLPLLVERWEANTADTTVLIGEGDELDEPLVYLLLDKSGGILLRSSSAAEAVLPTLLPGGPRYVMTSSHVFYITEPNANGLSVLYGDPVRERREAYSESLVAFFLPMLALLPLGYFLVGWVARSGLAPLRRLGDEIAARGEGRLDPISVDGLPVELRTITATTNGLMMRLGQALEGERSFASNAAHELRTPVAVALAQTQRLKSDVGMEDLPRVERIESALVRMSRLVTRLLQLARADAGIGVATEPHDLRKLLAHILDDVIREPASRDRLKTSLPETPVPSPIDPDAFAILAANLIDNAFQHSPGGSTVTVELLVDGCLRVSNAGPRLDQRQLSRLTARFHRIRTGGSGLGLGLHISDAIARQAGGVLILRSPASGTGSGFEATFKAPAAAKTFV